jgi:valyl-tRNA synthetase
MKVGRRLAIKILNASRFALNLGPAPVGAAATEPLDRSVLNALAELVDEATKAFEAYDYARALQRTEAFFWTFCDDYLELVKTRAYAEDPDDAGAASARATLELALSTLLRLFAPFLPYATEEVWSWWQEGSVHRAPWPDAGLRLVGGPGDPAVLAVCADVLGAVRRAKSDAKVSMRAEVRSVVVGDTDLRLAVLAAAAEDVRDAGRIAELTWSTSSNGAEAEIRVALADG